MTTDQTDRPPLVPPDMVPIIRDIAAQAREHSHTAAELVVPLDASDRERLRTVVFATAARAVAILAALEAARVNSMGTVPRG